MGLKNFKIIFINILIIIFLYVISSILGKHILQNNNYYYFNIPLVLKKEKIFSAIVSNPSMPIPNIDNHFFERFIDHLNNDLSLREKLTKVCPEDIFDYNSRKIKIFDVNLTNKQTKSFSVLISTYKINITDMDQCFQSIFVNSLNEYYLNSLSDNKEILNLKLMYLKDFKKELDFNYNQKSENNYATIYNLNKIKEIEFHILLLNNIKELVDPQIKIENKSKINNISSTIKIFTAFFLINLLIQILFFLNKKKKSNLFNKFFGI